MKDKLIITFLLSAYMMSAQEHMTFKGIEIDGKPSEMAKKLETVGFTRSGTEDNIEILSGKFAGYDASIGICPNVDGNACMVAVIYDDNLDSWSLLKNRFDSLEKNLIKKYGKPTNEEKTVDKDDFIIMSLANKEASWSSIWDTSNGQIKLSIMVSSNEFFTYSKYVVLGYIDNANHAVDEQQAYDDL